MDKQKPPAPDPDRTIGHDKRELTAEVPSTPTEQSPQPDPKAVSAEATQRPEEPAKEVLRLIDLSVVKPPR